MNTIELKLDQEQYAFVYNLLLQEKRTIFKNKKNEGFPENINFIYDLIEKFKILKEQKK